MPRPPALFNFVLQFTSRFRSLTSCSRRRALDSLTRPLPLRVRSPADVVFYVLLAYDMQHTAHLLLILSLIIHSFASSVPGTHNSRVVTALICLLGYRYSMSRWKTRSYRSTRSRSFTSIPTGHLHDRLLTHTATQTIPTNREATREPMFSRCTCRLQQ